MIDSLGKFPLGSPIQTLSLPPGRATPRIRTTSDYRELPQVRTVKKIQALDHGPGGSTEENLAHSISFSYAVCTQS